MSSPRTLVTHANVVSPLQIRVAQLLGRSRFDYGVGFHDVGLRLDGGTALANYYFGHPESDDLDYFALPQARRRRSPA